MLTSALDMRIQRSGRMPTGYHLALPYCHLYSVGTVGWSEPVNIHTVDVKKLFHNLSKLSPTIYMTIYRSTTLQSVNIKTLKSSNRSNKIMFAYLLKEQ